ncbi:MAG: glycosyltransferase family 9 protein, partial [Bacilli bacterium]|nr:glycosyltransferase family 9 protein [Bacilli bacterium]
YGSAKRWYPSYFADVAMSLSSKFDIVIFGGNGEKEICDEISYILTKSGISHRNLCGKTSIKELASYIAGLELFITNDSGPMHIAAAFKVPTVALFGPTNFTRTSPYNNPKARLAHLNLPCMPCMKRVCPLGSHECMKELKPALALELARQII